MTRAERKLEFEKTAAQTLHKWEYEGRETELAEMLQSKESQGQANAD